MNINVPQWAEGEFWDEPPEGSWEFWSFRFPPPCKVGDPLVFKMRGVVVARAVCAAIEPPGICKCDHSGRFLAGHKVFWKNESFEKVAEGLALFKPLLREQKNRGGVADMWGKIAAEESDDEFLDQISPPPAKADGED